MTDVHNDLSSDRVISIEDITDAVCQSPSDQKGFLEGDGDRGVRPMYAKEISTIYLLMHWPMFKLAQQQEAEENQGMSLYAAVLPHGRAHVAEIFFVNEATGAYVGSHMVFKVNFPGGEYLQDYDEWLMEELASKVLGVHREKTLGHELNF